MFTLFVVMSLCADPTEPPAIPEGVLKFRKEVRLLHQLRIELAEKKLTDLNAEQQTLAKTKLTAKFKASQRKSMTERLAVLIAEAEEAVDAAKKRQPSDYSTWIGFKPQIGDVGTVGTVHIVDANDAQIIVEQTGSRAYSGAYRVVIPPKNDVMIEGVDSSKWANGTDVDPLRTFEAVRVDKKTRLMVLKPFDLAKWKSVIDAEVKPEVKPKVKPK